MTRTIPALIAILVLGIGRARAQPPARDTRPERADATRGQIDIRVVDDIGHAVAGALVLLRGGPPPRVRTAIAAEDGGCTFSSLPAGRFTLAARKDGRPPVEYGAERDPHGDATPIALAAGAHVTLTVRMPRGGVISGRVLDESGRPAPGSFVSIRRARRMHDERPSDTLSAWTDNVGRYRVFGLAAGRYLVRALRRSASAQETEPTSLPIPVTVTPGDERTSVDLMLPPPVNAATTVTLVATMPDGRPAQHIPVVVTRKSDGLLLSSYGTPIAEDSVAIPNVPAGTYTIAALGRTKTGGSWGRAEFVADGVSPVQVTTTLRPGVTVQGRVIFAGDLNASAHIPAVDLRPVGDDANVYRTILQQGTQSRVAADGTFTITNVPPGRYSFEKFTFSDESQPWHLESVMVGETDALDTLLTVDADHDVNGVVATAVNVETEITGTVKMRGASVAGADLVAYAADPALRRRGSRRTRIVRTDAAGRYAVRGLPPGRYAIAVLTDPAADPVEDPSVLSTLRPLGTVPLARGETKTRDFGPQM